MLNVDFPYPCMYKSVRLTHMKSWSLKLKIMKYWQFHVVQPNIHFNG